MSKSIPKAIAKLHGTVTPLYGKGSFVYTTGKQKYLDYTSGIGALSTGHSHPYVLDKVVKQVGNIVHAPQQVFGSHSAQKVLNNKLITLLPKKLSSIFYTSSGSEATDNAIKIARRITGKTNVVSIRKGFHGRTMGAMSVSSSNIITKFRSQPLIPGIFFCDPTFSSLDEVLENNTSPKETACVIVEPVQGEGGVYDISSHFLCYLRQVCDNENIMLITDEVQCGSGRTGTIWNFEQKDILPDLFTFGKGIASGFPMAGVIGNTDIMNSLEPGYLGGTYGGNAVASAAASATIDVILNEKLLNNSQEMGMYIGNWLKNIPGIYRVRQYGLMIAFQSDIPARNIMEKLRDEHNVLVLLAGNKNQYIRILPPLNTTKEEAELFLESVENVIKNSA